MKVPSAEADVSCSQSAINRPGMSRQLRHRAKSSPKLSRALCLVVFLVTPMIWLCFYGEAFFSLTHRLPAEVLVVEGWIGNDGIRAASLEFEGRGYKYIVTTGGQTPDRQNPANYAELAEQELIGLGVPQERIVVAPTGEIEHERTFKSAVAAWRALQKRGIHPRAINVLTLGPHARRTRLVYGKVYAPATLVGMIAWAPAYYHTQPWWESNARTKCFLKEIVGYPFEVLLNSGRASDSPG